MATALPSRAARAPTAVEVGTFYTQVDDGGTSVSHGQQLSAGASGFSHVDSDDGGVVHAV